MTSIRHNPFVSEPAANATDAYLDAARDALLDLGWSRTTLTEIARRAGVSRMTLYRAWPDMNALLGDLMTREWSAVLVVSEAADHRERIVASIVESLHALRANEIFARILDLDADRLLPYLLQRPGRVQNLLITFLAEAIDQGQKVRQVRAGNPDTIARALILQAQGFALSASVLAPDKEALAAIDQELADALMRYLAP